MVIATGVWTIHGVGTNGNNSPSYGVATTALSAVSGWKIMKYLADPYAQTSRMDTSLFTALGKMNSSGSTGTL